MVLVPGSGTTLTARLLEHYAAAPERAAITLLQPRQTDATVSVRRLVQGAGGSGVEWDLRAFVIGGRYE